jgi:uridine phosphorylase
VTPIHLQPTAPLAPRILLPGDPGRALALATALLEQPKMFNHNRGLWGYTGTAADGHPLTIQSTGMGGPSAAIVISELADLGAERLIRVGTCGSLSPELELGQILVASEAIATDGASRALGARERVGPDPKLLMALAASARSAVVASVDLFYDGEDQALADRGAEAVEMETATLFILADRRGLAAAAALIVSDLVLPARSRITQELLQEAEHEMGRLAAAALSVSQPAT